MFCCVYFASPLITTSTMFSLLRNKLRRKLFNSPVVMLSRACLYRQDKHPILTDFSDSASLTEEADQILQRAVQNVRDREKDILTEAKTEADRILRRAEENAAMELKKAESTIKNEIVEVSTKLSEKILQREISAEDHEDLINSFINEIGEEHNEKQ